jgi:hypothetical protein
VGVAVGTGVVVGDGVSVEVPVEVGAIVADGEAVGDGCRAVSVGGGGSGAGASEQAPSIITSTRRVTVIILIGLISMEFAPSLLDFY